MNIDNQDEIVATGELFKQSTSGSKTWALRKFVLAGIYLVYFNKKGERKGQWEILNCRVREMSAAEVGSIAAKYAFAIVGPKATHVLCASNEKNRVAWTNLITEQIEEYSDILRRFLRTGEEVIGNGTVRKKNVFGISSNIRMLITNYPRILHIDDIAEVLTDQMSWDRQTPPSFFKISETKFRIALNRKEFVIEDTEQGSAYWESVFRRFPDMKYFVQRKRGSMIIDFNENDEEDYYSERERLESIAGGEGASRPKKRMSAGDQGKGNIKFLQDAMTNIDDLVNALAGKIEEIDHATAMAGILEDEDEITPLKKQIVEDRRLKRDQLAILKDNVSVLSSNLQSLVTRSMERGTTNFDIDAIETVITETAAMLMMLGRESEGAYFDNAVPVSGTIEESARFEAEVQAMDEIAAEYEREAEKVEDMIDNIEFHDITSDEMIEEIGATFESINIYEVPITPSNFDAFDNAKRPSNWRDIRLKRVLIREFVYRLEGVPDAAITQHRKAIMDEEEEIMVSEMMQYGRLLNMEILQLSSVLQAAITVTDDNFLATNPTKRPLAWQAVRLKRVVVREDQARRDGTDEATILHSRTNRVLQEEKLMLNEVAKHGQVLSLGGYDYSSVQPGDLFFDEDEFNPRDPSARPKGWFEVRTKRVLIKEQMARLNGMDDDQLASLHEQREEEEEAIMLGEVKANEELAEFGSENDISAMLTTVSMLRLTEENFDPNNYYTRPAGWAELRRQRVLVKELSDRLEGIHEEAIAAMRVDRERREEELMIDEAVAALTTHRRVTIAINESNFDKNDNSVRPLGWAELRQRRVTARERMERQTGASKQKIESSHDARIAKEEELMVHEATTYGGVLVIDVVYGYGKKQPGLLSSPTELLGKSGLFEFGLRKGAITKATFEQDKKPNGWNEIRNKRIAYKEQVLRLRGVTEDELAQSLPLRKKQEDAIMMKEAEVFSNVLLQADGPVQLCKFTGATLDGNARPSGWETVKYKRVNGRVRADRDHGVTELQAARNRVLYFEEEERKMLAEMNALDGVVICGQGADFEVDADSYVPTRTGNRPALWSDLQAKRCAGRGTNYAEEETNMMQEMAMFGNVMIVDKPTDFVITSANYENTMPGDRPAGWEEVQAKRVMLLEKAAAGSEDANTMKNKRGARVLAEERAMMAEVTVYGSVRVVEANLDFAINDDTYDANNPSKRPKGWADQKKLRLQAREETEIFNGGDERLILQGKAKREKDEEALMIAEVAKYGALLPLGGYRRTSKIAGMLTLSPRTFDPNSPTLRPIGWAYTRIDRLLARESIDRGVGVAESTILTARSKREKDEEALMLKEVSAYGSALVYGKASAEIDRFKGMRQLVFNQKNFDPDDASKRPIGWSQIKLRRVLAKEVTNTGPLLDKAEATAFRIALEKDEEVQMIQEFTMYRTVLGLLNVTPTDLLINPKTFSEETGKRPDGWDRLRLRRVLLKEEVDLLRQVPLNSILEERPKRLDEEEQIMLDEVKMYGEPLNASGTLNVTDLATDESNFAAGDTTKRPPGWFDLRLHRVMLREELDRELGLDDKLIFEARRGKLLAEELLMAGEVEWYGFVLNVDEVFIGLGKNLGYGQDNLQQRSPEWLDLRQKRVLAKEAVQKAAGLENPREKVMAEEDTLMLKDLENYNCILSIPTRLSEDSELGVTSLDFTEMNFDVDVRTKRPPGWLELKLKRLAVQEQTDRIAGLPEEKILQKREEREEAEEEQMLIEVQQYMAANSKKVFRGRKDSATNNGTLEDASGLRRSNQLAKSRRVETIRASRQVGGLRESPRAIRTSPRAGNLRASPRGTRGTRYEFTGIEIDPSTFDPKAVDDRPEGWMQLRMKRVILREQADRQKGMDEEKIVEQRKQREKDEEELMVQEVLTHGTVLGGNKPAANSNTAEQPAAKKNVLEITRTNYEAQDLTKRPEGWADLRLKRVMLKEHLDRIGGVPENVILEMRPEREVAEEVTMIDEVTWLGRVQTVGETKARPTADKAPHIVISTSNFDANNPLNRPKGWKELLKTRVMVKEQYDRLHGSTEADIFKIRATREADEEDLLIEEAKKSQKVSLLVAGTHMKIKVAPKVAQNGAESTEWDRDSITNISRLDINQDTFDPSDLEKRPTGWRTVRKKRILMKEKLDRLRGVKETEIIARRELRIKDEEKLMIKEVQENGTLIGLGGVKPDAVVKNKFDNMKNVEDILDVTDEVFDPTSTARPKGWATVKLRRVLIKEWQDRKEGLDEDDIMNIRYQRELEAEQEMIQEMSVLGRIKKFERMAQRNRAAAAAGPAAKSKISAQIMANKKSPEERAEALTGFIKAANQTLGNLSDRVAGTLAEKNLGGGGSGSYLHQSTRYSRTNVLTASSGPRVIDTGRGPRGNVRPLSTSQVKSFSPTPLEAAFKSVRLRRVHNSVAELDLSPTYFDPYNPMKRPPGWADLRKARVEELEAKDRSYGVDESIIERMRADRNIAEEERMIEEAGVAQRVKEMEEQRAGAAEKTFFGNFAENRVQSMRLPKY